MADVFEPRTDLDPSRERLWALIEQTPCLDWLLLTKRPGYIKHVYADERDDNLRVNVSVVANQRPKWRQRDSVYQFEQLVPRGSIKFARLKATLRVAFTEGVGFEYIIPLAFPMVAGGCGVKCRIGPRAPASSPIG